MVDNPLIVQAADDRHSACCAKQICTTCGSHVSTYNCNNSLCAARPEAANQDWWIACDNAECKHAYGEGVDQGGVVWVTKL